MVAEKEHRLRVVVDGAGPIEGTERVEWGVPARRLTAEHAEAVREALNQVTALRIPVTDLRNVDRAYQRERKDRLVKRLKEKFDWRAVGAPLVNRREDGSYWVIDGQHRVAAVRELLGEEAAACEMLCLVLPGIAKREEAQTWRKQNARGNRIVATVLEDWACALEAEDAETLKIRDILAGLGLSVGTTRSATCLQSVGAIRGIYEQGQPGDLKRVLTVAQAAWPDDPMAFKAVVLNGLYAFLARYRKDLTPTRERELVERLARRLPDQVMAQGKDIKKDAAAGRGAGSLHASPATCFARAVLAVYNRGTSTNALPPWFADDAGPRR